MSLYTFQCRFDRSRTSTLGIDERQWAYKAPTGGPDITLCSPLAGKPIKDATRLVLRGDGWPSKDAAEKAASRYTPVLKVTLARLRVGADFGGWGPESVFTDYGLEYLEKQTGKRHLNDVHGLSVFESNPPPVFAHTSVDAVRSVPEECFLAVFSKAAEVGCSLSDTEETAFRLFNVSCFQSTADARFLLLVMAIESLLELGPRPPASEAHVASMIEATKRAQSLSESEKASLLGSLEWLKSESIASAGRRLAQQRLADKQYSGSKAAAFFTHAYGLRSRLVHGKKPFPSFGEVNSIVGPLESFASDLLTQPHLPLD